MATHSTTISNRNLSFENHILLCWAIRNRKRETILRILKLDVNWKTAYKNGDTVLHLALYKSCTLDSQFDVISILRIFLDRGVDINLKNNEGKTVLHLAVKNKLKRVIDFLINNGADLNVCDEDGNSIAHFAVFNEFDRFCKICYVCDKPHERKSCELVGKYFMDWLMIKGMNVNCTNNAGLTPLLLAVNFNLQHVIPTLLEYTDNINFIDDSGRNILHIFLESLVALNNGGSKKMKKATSIPTFCYDDRYIVQIVKMLLDRGVSVSAVDKYGNTPLHLAAKHEKDNVINLLLENFNNVNARDDRGNTVLHSIIDTCIENGFRYRAEYFDIVEILLSKGSNINIKNEDGLLPVQLAALRKNMEIMKLLESHGADLNVTHDRGNLLHFCTEKNLGTFHGKIVEEIIDYIIDKTHCDLNFKNKNGFAPLHLSLRSGDPASLEKLVERGANVHSRTLTRHRYSSLHLAVINNQDHSVEVLVKAGADINSRDAFGRTPLHLAVKYGSAMPNLLLRLGAHIELQDDERDRPLHVAVRHENFEGVRELLDFGVDVNDFGTLRKLKNLLCPENMINCLLRQWFKLKTIGLPVNDDYMLYIDKWENFEYQKQCFEEVEVLKTHLVGKNFSLYDFMHMNLNRQCAFAKDFEDHLDSLILEDQYPEYANVVLAAFRQAVARHPLIWPAIRAWYHLTDVYLPEFCVEHIVAYLDNADLRVMIEGAIDCSVRMAYTSKSIRN